MDKILATLQTTLQRWDLHPVVDHFTIGLLIVGVLIDCRQPDADANLASIYGAAC